MGKRSAGRYHKNKGGSKKIHKEWSKTSIPQDNKVFRQYYQLQLNLPQQQFNQFWATMKDKLPVVFRVNPTFPNYKSFCNKINNENFMKQIVRFEQFNKQQMGQQLKQHIEPKQMPKIQLLKWYPGDIVYSINTHKQQFKKSKILSELHKYLQKSFDSGLISRQQLVSMLPPLYLQIHPDDIILDMCAAPGSKTSQLLQMICRQGKSLGKGCVIANDADYSRAQMLIHQINRAGTAGVAVINHPGQFLPELYTQKINHIKNKFQFDKILCDVPCSGDGATRKIPVKWANWHTSDGISLHPLQLSILMKSINLLKRGGLIVYSTCSLNPIQDQAVLHALFQKVTKGLQIVDIHQMYKIKGRRGLLNWKVCGISQKDQKDENGFHVKQLKHFQKLQDVNNNNKYKSTLFPPATQQQAKKIGLQNSMRILPHDQNSGGFFIALLKKHQDFQWKYDVKNEKKQNDADLQEKFVNQNLPEMDQNVVVNIDEPVNKQNAQKQDQSESQKQQQAVEQKNQFKMDVQNQKEENLQDKKQSKNKENKGSKYQTFLNIDKEEFQIIKKFYGIQEDLQDLLYVRQNGTNQRKVILVSRGVRQFLQADTANRIKLVNMGCKVFQKGKQSFSGHQCLYRLCQQGIHYILPLIQKRKIRVPLNFFKKVLSIHSLTHDQIDDIQVKEKIRAMTQGSFCIYVDEQIDGQRIVDALVGQNFKNSLHLMISREDTASLNIRYL